MLLADDETIAKVFTATAFVARLCQRLDRHKS
jgi:hypothetical protein